MLAAARSNSSGTTSKPSAISPLNNPPPSNEPALSRRERTREMPARFQVSNEVEQVLSGLVNSRSGQHPAEHAGALQGHQHAHHQQQPEAPRQHPAQQATL